MAVKTGDLESEFIESVCARVRERLPEPEAAMAQSFARQFYHWVPASDLAGRTEEDLYDALISPWELGTVRAPHEVKVRVFNPDPSVNGSRRALRRSPTVVEIVSDDMPFIVDSVTMELARA